MITIFILYYPWIHYIFIVSKWFMKYILKPINCLHLKNSANDYSLSIRFSTKRSTTHIYHIHKPSVLCFAIHFRTSYWKHETVWMIFCHSLLSREKEKTGKNVQWYEKQTYLTHAGSINHVKMACAATNEKENWMGR